MSVRLGTLLCLTGLVACSNNTNQPPAQDPTYANEPTPVATEQTMKPASFEESTPTRSTTPTPSERSAAANTPSTADMKGTAPGASKPDADAQKAPTAAPADTAPDNTKVNKRDNNSATPTPMDQGNGKNDLKITQQIRQAVMANGSLSFTAKNVKIITQGGKVTLRGPVNSDQERSDIEAAARKVAGVTEVDNQLEVKK